MEMKYILKENGMQDRLFSKETAKQYAVEQMPTHKDFLDTMFWKEKRIISIKEWAMFVRVIEE